MSTSSSNSSHDSLDLSTMNQPTVNSELYTDWIWIDYNSATGEINILEHPPQSIASFLSDLTTLRVLPSLSPSFKHPHNSLDPETPSMEQESEESYIKTPVEMGYREIDYNAQSEGAERDVGLIFDTGLLSDLLYSSFDERSEDKFYMPRLDEMGRSIVGDWEDGGASRRREIVGRMWEKRRDIFEVVRQKIERERGGGRGMEEGMGCWYCGACMMESEAKDEVIDALVQKGDEEVEKANEGDRDGEDEAGDEGLQIFPDGVDEASVAAIATAGLIGGMWAYENRIARALFFQ